MIPVTLQVAPSACGKNTGSPSRSDLALERAAVAAPDNAEACGDVGSQLRAVLRDPQGPNLAATDPVRANAALAAATVLGFPF